MPVLSSTYAVQSVYPYILKIAENPVLQQERLENGSAMRGKRNV